ncbi:hypothetical protein ACYULU_07630 [Breznakiellaceae bacterium SP9]
MAEAFLYSLAKDMGRKLSEAAVTLGKLGMKAGSNLFQWIGEHTRVDEVTGMLITELPPINVSLVAPSGAGKTTLLSTVMMHTRKALNKAGGFQIRPKLRTDEIILSKFDTDLEACIAAGSIEIDIGSVPPTLDSQKYTFEIVYENKDKKVSVTQPFVMMDIPGGWLDPERRPEVKYNEFKEHLHKSSVLWIPVEAPLLMKAIKPLDKAAASKLMKIQTVGEIAQEWAQFRGAKPEEPASVFFAPVKCETYFSKDKSGKFAKEFEALFDEKYRPMIKDIKDACHVCGVFYAPLESLGCINLIDAEWKDGQLLTEYKIIDPPRKVAGAEALTYTIYEYGADQIVKAFGMNLQTIEKMVNHGNPFKWLVNQISGRNKEVQKQLDDLKEMIECLTQVSGELKRITESAMHYPYFKVK